MPELTAIIEYEVECDTCGDRLKAANAIGSEQVIAVEPCSHCLAQEREKAHEDAMEEQR